MWVIKTAESAAPPFSFRILAGNMKTVGRAAGADFVVDATLVSRLHCRLTAGAAELEVVDLDSTNGTYVNGQRVSRGLLRNGDLLTVGDIAFRVERAEDAR
jgi:pSer/pThr/pTyr-binding forkhead associated (FHA) protein